MILKTFFRSFGLCVALGMGSGNADSRGWTVLFDGTSTDQFRGYKKSGFPSHVWVVARETLKTVPGKVRVDLVTRESYRDFDLEFEWKVAPGGNSGVFYRVSELPKQDWHSAGEYQILDNAGHKDGKNPLTTAASLYGLVAPQKALLAPVGEFNRSRIVAEGRRAEHWLNGVLVCEYEIGSPELAGLIAGSKFKDFPHFMRESEGLIAFQHHGQEVWYRNIRIRRLPASNRLSVAEREAGWKLLFDGRSTAGWRSYGRPDFPSQGWEIVGDCLKLSAKPRGGDIITRDRYGDFDFRCEWQVASGANSGIKYFILEKSGSAVGHEYHILDVGSRKESQKHQTANFYAVLPAANVKPRPAGEFNQSRIRVEGRTVEHWLNGDKVLEYELGSEQVLHGVQGSKFRGVAGFGYKKTSHILLQDHGGEIAFRNLKIRPLTGP